MTNVHVHIVVSTLPEAKHGCLQRLRTVITSPEQYVEVPRLDPAVEGLKLVRALLEGQRRGVTAAQEEKIEKALLGCSLPLYIKLLVGEAALWRSWMLESECTLSISIPDMINALLERIEGEHGRIFVSHALGYLTAAKRGLSEQEV